MRCRFCGSTSLHDDTQDKRFSAGKAVAGTIVFGLPGAAAGLIGKKVKGYRCSACGSFMETPMDAFTEVSIDNAIRNAESGRDRSSYDYYKGQYPNIQANLPVQGGAQVTPANIEIPLQIAQPSPDSEETIKRSYRYGLWQPDCPVYVEGIILKSTPTGDKLSLIAWNSSDKTIRSAYFQAKVLDDTGDVVSEVPFVYQGISVRPGMEGKLPENKEFDLKTDLAYKVELTCDKVAFEGDEVWRNEAGTVPFALPIQPVVDQTNFPRFKYVKTKYSESFGVTQNKSLFMPLKENGYWLCDCGQPVLGGGTCPRCGDTWDALESTFSQKHLQELQQIAVKERAAKRAEEMAAFTETTRANKEKADLDFKEATYSDAVRLQLDGSIESLRSAVKAFALVPGWRDADERATACRKLADEKEEAERIVEEKRKEEKRLADETHAKKNRRIAAIVIPLVVIAVVAVGIFAGLNESKRSDLSVGSVGKIKYFGTYPQEAKTLANRDQVGREIEWIVLAREENKVLLISRYILDCEPFNKWKSDCTWDTCTLRNWLNDDFYYAAFSKDEQSKIINSTVSADANPDYSTKVGKSTNDKVFLLSITEAQKYFDISGVRQCKPTKYAMSEVRYNISEDAAVYWWLRTSGIDNKHAAIVEAGGRINSAGRTVDDYNLIIGCGIRPVIWVSF